VTDPTKWPNSSKLTTPKRVVHTRMARTMSSGSTLGIYGACATTWSTTRSRSFDLGHIHLLGLVLAYGWSTRHDAARAVGIICLGHVGWDRFFGYGFEYDSDFTHTHLGSVCKGFRPGRVSPFERRQGASSANATKTFVA